MTKIMASADGNSVFTKNEIKSEPVLYFYGCELI